MYKNIKSSSSIVGCSAPHRTTTTTGTVARREAFRNSLKQLRYWQIFSTFFGPFSSARSIDLVLIQPLSFECCFFMFSSIYFVLPCTRSIWEVQCPWWVLPRFRSQLPIYRKWEGERYFINLLPKFRKTVFADCNERKGSMLLTRLLRFWWISRWGGFYDQAVEI